MGELPERPDAEDSQTVGFIWTVEDLREYEGKVVAPFFDSIKGVYLTGVIITVVAILVTAGYVITPWDTGKVFVMTMAAEFAVFFLAAWVFWRVRRLEHIRAVKDPRHVSATWVRIDRYGVTTAGDVNMDFLSWFGIQKVEVYAMGVFFRSGPIHGVYVPRRAFEQEGEFDAFCANVKRYREQKLPPPHMDQGASQEPEEPFRLN